MAGVQETANTMKPGRLRKLKRFAHESSAKCVMCGVSSGVSSTVPVMGDRFPGGIITLVLFIESRAK